MITATQIEKNWLKIQEKIKNINGNVNAVKVIPVTKSVGIAEIKSLMSLGFSTFAENRIEKLSDKINQLSNPTVKWDFIGNIQSRKIPDIISCANLIHSVGSTEIINKINSCANKMNKIIDILIQVNVAAEPQKGGFNIEECKQQFKQFLHLNHIRIKGLMTMAPQTDDKNLIRKVFKGLRELRDLFQKDAYADFKELSMGMSDDFEIAIQEGATIIRVGSSFFKENDI